MTEIWLHSNRRILLLAMVPVWLLGSLGGLVFAGDWLSLPGVVGAGCLGVALLLLVGLVRQILLPRIAYRDGYVLFYFTARRPIAVPLSVVEAFFQGQGPAHLPGESRHGAKSVNLIARLSQRETDWQQREVKPALGNWSEGYVTIRGAWCEPITEEVIRQLNRRLGEVSRERRAQLEGMGSV